MATTIDLEDLVARLAARKTPRSEADVQADVRTLLLYGGLNLRDSQLQVLTEASVQGGRRIDVEVGFTVIEIKKDLTLGSVKRDAILQLEGYVAGRTAALQQRYVGVLTDGADWYLYHLDPASRLEQVAEFHTAATTPTNTEGLLVWLEGVLATTQAVRPTPDAIRRRLGAGSPSYELDRASLTALYGECQRNPHVRLKRELWSRLLTTAYGLHFSDSDHLFVEHTYLVLAADLIAHAVVGFALEDSTYSADELVSGRLFQHAGIGGVVEPDFFDWVLESAGGSAFVQTLARRLSRFEWRAVEHDVLKILYESVIDAQQRHDLGEYYTPDWLADRMVHAVVDNPLQQRVLDPACGSGTFLFHAVRQYIAAAEEANHPSTSVITGVTEHVVGVDIHPVAVTLARVTYLLALGSDRLLAERPPFAVPVYLGDSLQWHRGEDLLASGSGVVIHTSDGAELFARELRFPLRVVADAELFDRLVSELADRASKRSGGVIPPITAVLRRYGIHNDDEAQVTATFRALCQLHDEGLNHIWGYYIRNVARPRWLAESPNRVDTLIGNPPWLAYRYMPLGLQQEFKTQSSERGLWAGGAVANIQDLSGYFLVRCSELYLRVGGRFAFVMPGALLTRKQYKGFRTGEYASRLRVTRFAFERAGNCQELWNASC